MAMIFYTLIFLALVFVVVNHFYSLQSLLNTLMIIVIIFNFLRFGILYFKFQRNISIKKIHLFSYLCSTELIPIVIGLNFFLK
jgi:type III secretory pathway component EscU